MTPKKERVAEVNGAGAMSGWKATDRLKLAYSKQITEGFETRGTSIDIVSEAAVNDEGLGS